MTALPFEIVSEAGDRAEAEDEAGALQAARTLRRDHRDGAMAFAPVVHILYEGRNVLTITKGMTP